MKVQQSRKHGIDEANRSIENPKNKYLKLIFEKEAKTSQREKIVFQPMTQEKFDVLCNVSSHILYTSQNLTHNEANPKM